MEYDIKIEYSKEQDEAIRMRNTNYKGQLDENKYRADISELVRAKKVYENIFHCDMKNYRMLEDQVNKGDYLVNNSYNLEVKTSCCYNNGYSLIPQLAINVRHIQKGDDIVDHIQSSTGNSLGYLYTCKADKLICDNDKLNIMFNFNNWQDVAKKLKYEVEEYLNKVSWEGWRVNGNRNYINKYITGAMNTKDKHKDDFIIFLKLTRESLDYFDFQYDIIRYEDVIIDNKKTSNSTGNTKRC